MGRLPRSNTFARIATPVDRHTPTRATDSTAETTLDVREIDGAPFDDVMNALEDLANDGRLHLIAPFEPKPLYEVLSARGYTHETEQRDDAWHVFIERA